MKNKGKSIDACGIIKQSIIELAIKNPTFRFREIKKIMDDANVNPVYFYYFRHLGLIKCVDQGTYKLTEKIHTMNAHEIYHAGKKYMYLHKQKGNHAKIQTNQ